MTESKRSGRYVLFRLGAESYALPIEQVRSIIRYEPPTPVPHSPESVDGIVNLRGLIVPVVNLKQRLLGEPYIPTALSRIVIAEGAMGVVGVLVDAASEVATIEPGEVLPAPETALTPQTAEALAGVANIGERLVILLELDRALPGSDYGRVAGEGVEADV